MAVSGLATVIPISANTTSPNLSIALTTSSVPTNGILDTILYVNVPAATSNTQTLYILTSSFLVQSIDFQFIFSDGSTSSGNLITCAISPNYPSRTTISSCAGSFPQRVDSRAYSGSTTGIYLIGWAGLSPVGHATLTYTTTGLFQGSTITLTATAQFNIVDPPCCAPGPLTPQ